MTRTLKNQILFEIDKTDQLLLSVRDGITKKNFYLKKQERVILHVK